MKYYTKEWYELCQEGHSFRKIPDKDYTEAEINAFVAKVRKKYIADEKRSYNTAPSNEFAIQILESFPFDPEEWLLEDPDTGNAVLPKSREEVKEYLEKEQEKEMRRFLARAPFDAQYVGECFDEEFKLLKKAAKRMEPGWISENTDARLLALGLLPETACKRLRKEQNAKAAKRRRIERLAEEAYEAQDIPEDIQEALCLHDADLLRYTKRGKNIELLFAKAGIFPEGTPYIRITFRGAKVLEKDRGMKIRLLYPLMLTMMDEVSLDYIDPVVIQPADNTVRSNINFLCHEIYNSGSGLEVHMLLAMATQLKYLTIYADSITVEDNIEFPEE